MTVFFYSAFRSDATVMTPTWYGVSIIRARPGRTGSRILFASNVYPEKNERGGLQWSYIAEL